MFAERVTLTQLRRLAELNVRRRLVNVMNMYPPTPGTRYSSAVHSRPLGPIPPRLSPLTRPRFVRAAVDAHHCVCWLIFIGYRHTPSQILDDFRWALITIDSIMSRSDSGYKVEKRQILRLLRTVYQLFRR